eukprot:TRINITY_DN70602_c0_g1_i1.p1 TRINITY_DN70602_c0_g1~~TRINITY_DN70602_c0_g1_i1.p1  ORF type:complete len:103 (+),score=8.69 TRINITY_DN70602_c0_g1_i1:64-372(+)
MVDLEVSPYHVKMTSLQYRYYKASFINDIWPRVLFVHHSCSSMKSYLLVNYPSNTNTLSWLHWQDYKMYQSPVKNCKLLSQILKWLLKFITTLQPVKSPSII